MNQTPFIYQRLMFVSPWRAFCNGLGWSVVCFVASVAVLALVAWVT